MQSINKHFSREVKIMIGIFMVPIIIGVIAAFIIPCVLHQVEIDKCLDSGGKFEYQKNRCIGKSKIE
jgi:hypothetical protein